MDPLFDSRHVRRAFSRAAAGYDAAAALQAEVRTRLLESLAYLDDRQPSVVLDVVQVLRRNGLTALLLDAGGELLLTLAGFLAGVRDDVSKCVHMSNRATMICGLE